MQTEKDSVAKRCSQIRKSLLRLKNGGVFSFPESCDELFEKKSLKVH